MDGVSSIFSQLRKSRMAALNESREEKKDMPVLNESVKDEGFPIDHGEIDEGVNNEEALFDHGEIDEADLTVEATAVNGRAFTVHINGKKYSYFPLPDSEFEAKDLKKKFEGIAKHSVGKALAWLKKNATTNDSYRKGKSVEENCDESIDETFIVIKCADCGAILSALDEAEEGCPVCGSDDLDEKTVKVVKDGKVVTKNIATKKRKLTPAQKAALAKARKKAHSASANKARAKSMKVRAKKGMNEDDMINCPECGYEGPVDTFEEREDALFCPECGAEC